MLKQSYEVHPAATLFPMMTEDEYKGLKQDIADNGQHEDIIVWCGKLIDGRNRLRACEELGRQPEIAELDEETDPWKYVISHNLHRRHLTSSQRSSVAAKLAQLKHGEVGNGRKVEGQKCTSTIADAAKALSVSPRSVKNAKVVQEHGSEQVKQAVEQGELPVSLAAKLVKEVPSKREQTKLLTEGIDAVREAVSPNKKESTDDCKLDQFRKFWSGCSDISKAAIRIWIMEN